MNADAFRHLYDYHFAENRKLWEWYIADLSPDQFIRDASYAHGSVRHQLIHLMEVDEAWFGDLGGVAISESLDPADSDDRDAIRARWDEVERQMRGYLAALRDDMLPERPFSEGEDKDLILWQILIHVVNHGTDHRAQVLRALHDLGVRTAPQDYVFYAYDHILNTPDGGNQAQG